MKALLCSLTTRIISQSSRLNISWRPMSQTNWRAKGSGLRAESERAVSVLADVHVGMYRPVSPAQFGSGQRTAGDRFTSLDGQRHDRMLMCGSDKPEGRAPKSPSGLWNSADHDRGDDLAAVE